MDVTIPIWLLWTLGTIAGLVLFALAAVGFLLLKNMPRRMR